MLAATSVFSYPGDPLQPSLGCDPPDSPRPAQSSQGFGGHVPGSGDHGQQPLQQCSAWPVGSKGALCVEATCELVVTRGSVSCLGLEYSTHCLTRLLGVIATFCLRTFDCLAEVV